MSPFKAMQLLEVGESASVEQIKQSYRRLAQRCHPDKHGGDPASSRQFASITHAYHSLIDWYHVTQKGGTVGRCTLCKQFGQVYPGRYDRAYCHLCVFSPFAGHLLPMPALVVVKCVTTFILIGLAVVLLVLALQAAELADMRWLAGVSFLVGLLSLASLSATCMSVAHCLTGGEQWLRRQDALRRRRNLLLAA